MNIGHASPAPRSPFHPRAVQSALLEPNSLYGRQPNPSELSPPYFTWNPTPRTIGPAAASRTEGRRMGSLAGTVSPHPHQGTGGRGVTLVSCLKNSIFRVAQVSRLSTSDCENRRWPPGSRLGFKWCCFTYLWRVGRLMQRCLHTCSLVQFTDVSSSLGQWSSVWIGWSGAGLIFWGGCQECANTRHLHCFTIRVVLGRDRWCRVPQKSLCSMNSMLFSHQGANGFAQSMNWLGVVDAVGS